MTTSAGSDKEGGAVVRDVVYDELLAVSTYSITGFWGG
jgi:hypothetical protein